MTGAVDVSDSGSDRRAVRRTVLAAAAGGVLLGMAGGSRAQIAQSDTALLNFALNLQYLCGQFFSRGMFGNTLGVDQTRGFGFGGASPGTVTGGTRVAFGDRSIELPVFEVGIDTFNNITVLRDILRGDLVAQPAIDVSSDPFTVFMRAANAIGGGDTFDAFASQDNFLLGAYLINDTMLTAYRGMLPNVINPVVLATMTGLLTTRAANAATIRYLLYRRSLTIPSLLVQADRISDQRDRLDGSDDLDQGISPGAVGGQAVANIVAADTNGEVFSRTAQQVLNILYGSRSAVARGGFFPAGVAGTIVTSAAN